MVMARSLRRPEKSRMGLLSRYSVPRPVIMLRAEVELMELLEAFRKFSVEMPMSGRRSLTLL